MAGYSGTPLLSKLGIKPGNRICILNEPTDYYGWLSPLPEVSITSGLKGELDFIHLFVLDKTSFEKEFIKSKKHLKKTGMIWISWPKKSSKVLTDLDDTVIREFGLSIGLVDVKVCAVSDVWSGLKFMFRIKDR